MAKLIKNKCEIFGCEVEDGAILELHHIIERTEEHCNNGNNNLAILCPNHHAMIHSGRLRVIGVYPSTKLPNKRILIYELDGIRNVDGIDRPYLEIKNKSYKL